MLCATIQVLLPTLIFTTTVRNRQPKISKTGACFIKVAIMFSHCCIMGEEERAHGQWNLVWLHLLKVGPSSVKNTGSNHGLCKV